MTLAKTKIQYLKLLSGHRQLNPGSENGSSSMPFLSLVKHHIFYSVHLLPGYLFFLLPEAIKKTNNKAADLNALPFSCALSCVASSHKVKKCCKNGRHLPSFFPVCSITIGGNWIGIFFIHQ